MPVVRPRHAGLPGQDLRWLWRSDPPPAGLSSASATETQSTATAHGSRETMIDQLNHADEVGRCEVTGGAGSLSADLASSSECSWHDPAAELVLSLFPGIDLLGRGFEAEGFAVLRGPDLLWDQKIESFRMPPDRVTGIIGGPPCQNYSDANRARNTAEGDRLVREFLRIVTEARPAWFLMENVRMVPDVRVPGYRVQRLDLTDCECGGKQRRLRHLQFGSRSGEIIRPLRTDGRRPVTPAVLCGMTGPNDRHSRRLARQGAPRMPLRALTSAARARAIGNAVPWLMAVALARAVTRRSSVTPLDCVCGCGRLIPSPAASHANPSCRKRMERRRRGHGRVIEV